jgi:hypothetical protein
LADSNITTRLVSGSAGSWLYQPLRNIEVDIADSVGGRFHIGYHSVTASGVGSFAQGVNGVTASNVGSLAQGNFRIVASNTSSFAQGALHVLASAEGAFAQGYSYITASGNGSFAQGSGSIVASDWGSFAQGAIDISATGSGSLAQGLARVLAAGKGSFAQGYVDITASAAGSFAQGNTDITAAGVGSFAQGGNGINASGVGSFAQGCNYVTASGAGSFAQGTGSFSGLHVVASGDQAAQFGPGTNALSASLQVCQGIRIADSTGMTYSANRNGDIYLNSASQVVINGALTTHLTGTSNPTSLAAVNTGAGEIVFFGTGSTLQGRLYFLNTDGGWTKTNANATGSLVDTGGGNASLLGLAVGTSPQLNGMMIRGFFECKSAMGQSVVGAWSTGSAVYVYSGSSANAGKITAIAPTAADSYVRGIGYCTDTEKVIYFDPDKIWIENNS